MSALDAADPELLAERERGLAALGPRPPWYRFRARRLHDIKRRAIEAVDFSRFAAELRRIYMPALVVGLSKRARPGAVLKVDARGPYRVAGVVRCPLCGEHAGDVEVGRCGECVKAIRWSRDQRSE